LTSHLEAICQMSVEIHNSVMRTSDTFFNELRRKNYTTPTSYLDLIKTYMEMLKFQRGIVPEKIKRYSGGLTRLDETNQMVDDLKQTLTKLVPQINQNEEETKQLLVDLEQQTAVANEQEKMMAKEKAESQILYDQVKEMKNDCQEQLEKAMPIYRSAVAALETLNKNDIIEMKSYKAPPEDLVLVIKAVCLLRDVKENWDEGKKLMN